MSHIRISNKVKNKLDERKTHKRQSYDEVIDSILEGEVPEKKQ